MSYTLYIGLAYGIVFFSLAFLAVVSHNSK